jgi:hypothetical protein
MVALFGMTQWLLFSADNFIHLGGDEVNTGLSTTDVTDQSRMANVISVILTAPRAN